MQVYFHTPDGEREAENSSLPLIDLSIDKRNYLNNAIDDLKDPKRTLPRSVVISLLICIFVYLLTFSSYFTALSAYEILMSDATAVSFAERVLPLLLYVIPVGVTMSCVGGTNFVLFMI